MATPQDRQLVEQWRSIQTTYFRTAGAIDRALESRFNIGLTEFEILDLVAESEDAATGGAVEGPGPASHHCGGVARAVGRRAHGPQRETGV